MENIEQIEAEESSIDFGKIFKDLLEAEEVVLQGASYRFCVSGNLCVELA